MSVPLDYGRAMASDARSAGVAVCLIGAMAVVTVVARHDRRAAWALLLLAACWVGVDHGWEGAVLLPVAHDHGLTVSDLPGVAAGLAAFVLWFRKV